MPGFKKDDKDGQIKWLIKMNEEKTKTILKLEKEIEELKQFIALREEYK